MGDDHVNPLMRPTVNRAVQKINDLQIMKDPRNRAHIVQRLANDLDPVNLADVLSFLHRMWWAKVSLHPEFKDLKAE